MPASLKNARQCQHLGLCYSLQYHVMDSVYFLCLDQPVCLDGSAEAILHRLGGDGHDNCRLPP